MAKGARINVTIEGGEELLRKLRQMGENVRGTLEAAALEGAEQIRGPASSSAPEPHVIAEVVDSGSRGVTVGIGPDEDHWYYRFLETGAQAHEISGSLMIFETPEGTIATGRVSHPGMAARPFLRPAFDRHKGDAEAAVGEKLKKVVERDH